MSENRQQSNITLRNVLFVFVATSIMIPFIVWQSYHGMKWDDWNSMFLSYLGGAIGGVATLIAIYISINETRKIQEDAIKLEEIREKNRIKENALIVYYDLLIGFKDLKKIYIYRILSKLLYIDDKSNKIVKKMINNTPKKLYFSNEWIRNVAVISNTINKEFVEKIYEIYGDLLTVSDYLEKDIFSLGRKYFNIFNEELRIQMKKINDTNQKIKKYEENPILRNSADYKELIKDFNKLIENLDKNYNEFDINIDLEKEWIDILNILKEPK